MAKPVSYTWLIEHLASYSREQLQDWIAAITYVPKGYVPAQICDADFAYHWYRYITRLANQFRKRPDEETTKLIFEMFADEPDPESRCNILRAAHRSEHMKLFPNCPKSERVIVQRTSREARSGKFGAEGVSNVRLTAYKRARRDERDDEAGLVLPVSNSEVQHG